MTIQILTADVKRKCMIAASDTAYDSAIDDLIDEMQPALEYTIADIYLGDDSNSLLQSLIKLAMLEIISGEFLQQLAREPGNLEQFSVGGVSIGEMKEKGPALVLQGSTRLAPFLRSDSDIKSTTRETPPVFDEEKPL